MLKFYNKVSLNEIFQIANFEAPRSRDMGAAFPEKIFFLLFFSL